MEGDYNQTTFDVNVYFVLPSNYESVEECNEDTLEAFHKCSEWEIQPVWISERKCLGMKPDKKDVFIFEVFKGEAFNQLQKFKCIIIGPRCLLSCFLTGEPIPDGTTPVFNTAMRGVIVTASGFSGAKKNEIQKLVEYMGGIFTKQLRSSVTHLVTEVVMSAKYERAIELGIKIVTFDWVQSVWDTNLKDSVVAKDSIFDKYVCPVFLNLVVTSTNLPKRQKEEVKKLINENGGEFMGVLDGTKVKVVITIKSSSLSEKLKYAMQNNIACLRVEWVYESIKAGYSLPFNDFIIKSTQACSTPEKSAIQESLNLSTISNIPGDNHNIFIDETLVSSTMSSSVMNSTALSEKIPVVSKNNYNSIVENLSIADAKNAGPFLDGCNIYLAGFSSAQRDKLNRILAIGCATRLDEISEALTHVIIGDPLKATLILKEIKSKELQPCILKIDWLVESLKIQSPALEDNFIFDCKESNQQNTAEPPSPLSKKALLLLKRPKIPPAPKFEPDPPEEKPTEDEPDIIQQYLQSNNSEKSINVTKNQSIAERWNDSTRREKSTLNEDGRDLSAIPISQESCVSQKILQGLVFTVGGFDDEDYTQILASIHGLGGKIVGKNYLGTPDYGVVPKFGGELKLAVKNVVSDLFIEDCIDSEKLIDVEYYHKPINIDLDVRPLKECVIGMSTYNGAKRTYLAKLAEALGARYQDTFARKTNLQKNTYSSTHLICPKPVGEKYNAAVKWKLPAVTAEWLIKCATEMRLADETLYLVGETMAPERPDKSVSNNASGNNTIVNENNSKTGPTPKRKTMNEDQYPEGTSEGTPVINKRLNNLIGNKTPQNDKSPFHVNTPDTPYGQVFKENPSPRTRKCWAQWMDHFPDLKEEEPPLKKRRSTPLSEVKRKAWEHLVMGRSQIAENNESTISAERKLTKDDDHNDTNEPESSHVTNRKLSFSDENSPPKTPKNPKISAQIAQLDELLSRASSTPERQSLSAEHTNQYHLEPISSGNCHVKESQPESVGWENPVKKVPLQPQPTVVNEEPINLDSEEESEDESVEPVKPSKLKFMFSGIKDKDEAEKSIKKIGGEVSTESAFDMTATHLLCVKPSRNEKILSSIASGKWVLHLNYLKACEREKKFVDEEEYELGNPKSRGNIPDPNNDSERLIMSAAHRWRLNLSKNPGGAFRDIVALLITQKEKRDQFERLINAGGGIVVEAKPPYNDSPGGKKITYCFVQPKQIDQQVDWAMMASKGIMCFPPQFLNDHLMSEKPLNPKDCVVPEFIKYLALMPK